MAGYDPDLNPFWYRGSSMRVTGARYMASDLGIDAMASHWSANETLAYLGEAPLTSLSVHVRSHLSVTVDPRAWTQKTDMYTSTPVR